MEHSSYVARRHEIETYFDRTAAQAWERLTSNAPLGRIRASVRAGRDRMRGYLLDSLPRDMRGLRVLDAGCGTGALAVAAVQRGAHVVAIDLSPTLVHLAEQRWQAQAVELDTGLGGSLQFAAGDMLGAEWGEFDHVVAMDSLIHYDAPDMVRALQGLSLRTRRSVLFTFAPRTPLLATMHSLGRWFPRSDRSPALTPVAEAELREALQTSLGSAGWREGRSQRVASGFYTSQAWEWTR